MIELSFDLIYSDEEPESTASPNEPAAMRQHGG
jgi:hypothetical protein